VLKTSQDGKPELVAKVDGKTVVSLTSDKTLPKNKWATLRVEIDGAKTAIWIDDGKVAEQASSFRPADVYPAGVEKRNFIAASRDATAHFQGTIDHLRVFHAVFEDFTASCRKKQEDFEAAAKRRDAAIKAKVDPIMAFYAEIGKKMGQRRGEINSAIAEAPEVTKATFKPEADWLECMQWLIFSHHYNYNYRAYVGKKVGREVGGGKLFHHNPDSLEARPKAKPKTKWYTRCDWE